MEVMFFYKNYLISFLRKDYPLFKLDKNEYPIDKLDFPNYNGREDYILNWWV
jgi:hypothetical protein